MYTEKKESTVKEKKSDEIQVKLDKETSTENEDPVPIKCTYCSRRLSKLRKIERIKSLRRLEYLGMHGKKDLKNTHNQGCQTPASLYRGAEMTRNELQNLTSLLSVHHSKTMQTESFCKCVVSGQESDCQCGEEDKYIEWVWDQLQRGDATKLRDQDSLVVFHEDYSCGTTAIRGLQAMEQDQYFWEIKMTSPVYGTDMMIGVGTTKVELNKFRNSFCSMLGCDLDSWGISYDGRVQHGGKKYKYCSRFGQGTIIGVHLDMWHGTLTFFKNRRSLGVAFVGLRGRILYPMASSTAARSGMKVISSRSFPSSLQFLCCQKLRKLVPPHLSVLDTLSMPPGLRVFLANNIAWLLHAPSTGSPKPNEEYICRICWPLRTLLDGCSSEEDSGGEEKVDIRHEIISIQDSENESSDEDLEDFSDRTLHRHSLTRYLVEPSLRRLLNPASTHSSFLSVPDAASSSRTIDSTQSPENEPAVKKRKLDGQESIGDGDDEIEEEEVGKDNLSQTQVVDLMEEGTDPERQHRLGKRKRT